jgi:hypothetical protein
MDYDKWYVIRARQKSTWKNGLVIEESNREYLAQLLRVNN